MRRLIVIASVLMLAACKVPVAVVGNHGLMMRGTADVGLASAGFTASDGTLTCTGSETSLSNRGPITANITCSDGRKGVVVIGRNSGNGHLRLSDGTRAEVFTGDAAKPFMDGPAPASPVETPKPTP